MGPGVERKRGERKGAHGEGLLDGVRQVEVETGG